MNTLGDKMAYVMQHDVLCPCFTPKQAFIFAANLKLVNMTQRERIDKVNDVIFDLGLEKCQNTLIGNECFKGISGGEKKRTSIGVELLTDPYLLFLDEPTTGLDSQTAYNIQLQLKQLAKQGINVVQTIHSPSTKIFQLFDQLILMTNGNLIYQGPSSSVINYFADIGFKCPQNYSSGDYLMKIMNIEGIHIFNHFENADCNADQSKRFNDRIKYMINSYYQSQFYNSVKPCYKQRKTNFNVLLVESVRTASYWTQFKMLIWRNSTVQLKNKWTQFVISWYIAVVYQNLKNDEKGIIHRFGALHLVTQSSVFFGIVSSVQLFTKEIALYKKELQNKSYYSSIYFITKNLVQIPISILLSTILTLIVYPGINLYSSEISSILIFWLVQNLAFLCAQAYGQILSIWFENEVLVCSMLPVLFLPNILFSGFVFNLSDNKVYTKFMEYISVAKYQSQSMLINEYSKVKFNCQRDCDPIKEKEYDLELWENIYYLIVLGCILYSIANLVLKMKFNPKAQKIEDPSALVTSQIKPPNGYSSLPTN